MQNFKGYLLIENIVSMRGIIEKKYQKYEESNLFWDTRYMRQCRVSWLVLKLTRSQFWEYIDTFSTMVYNGNRINVYVDFFPVMPTNTSDDALALLIVMYKVFDLSSVEKSRPIRLLYSVSHGENRYLSNSPCHFIRERNIDLYCEGKYRLLSSPFNL